MKRNNVGKKSGVAKAAPDTVSAAPFLALVENPNLWNYLKNDFTNLGCACHPQFTRTIPEEKLQKAKKSVREQIEKVFSQQFSTTKLSDREALIDLYALNLLLDQSACNEGFISKRTKKFCEKFKIKTTLKGLQIEPDINFNEKIEPKKYLLERLNIADYSFYEKTKVLRKLEDSVYEESLKIVDVFFADFVVDPASKAGKNLYQNLPSLANIALLLGTAMMILRVCDQQNTANNLRDNVGATTEMVAFFILANGILENLSHSLILAAPAYIATGLYDGIYRTIHRQNQNTIISTDSKSEEKSDDVEQQNSRAGNSRIHFRQSPSLNDDIFCGEAKESQKTYVAEIKALEKVQEYLQQDELWEGLRKRQLAYKDNPIENDLKINCNQLIQGLLSNVINERDIAHEYCATFSDIALLLKSYQNVYEKKSSDFQIKETLENFFEVFSPYGVFLQQPSKHAFAAQFCMKAHHQMVSFEDRIVESLPHLPSGRQFLLAAVVVAGIYSLKEIYSAITGQEETATNYVTDFPDYLFSWLQLGQMYENLGGDATISQSFRDFFAKFNLVENSTHLGIVVAPFFAYQQLGSKMFDNVGHQAANMQSYFAHSADYYLQKISSIFCQSEEQYAQINSKKLPNRNDNNNLVILEEGNLAMSSVYPQNDKTTNSVMMQNFVALNANSQRTK